MHLRPKIVGDRLYSIQIRPHELALYGDKVRFDLRYSPVFDDEDEVAERHFKLLILEIEVPPPPSRPEITTPLTLLKCGWELELSSTEPCKADELEELPEEIQLLIERIADTANELARRAGLEAPLGPELIERLVREYRSLPENRRN